MYLLMCHLEKIKHEKNPEIHPEKKKNIKKMTKSDSQ